MVRKITAIIILFSAISCGTKDKVEGVKGEKGDKGEKGTDGRDGQDGRQVQVTPAPAPVPTYYPQPVPQPVPQPYPVPVPYPVPMTPAYPVPVPQPVCDQCITVCACVDNRWQTISIHQSQVGNYQIKRFGSC